MLYKPEFLVASVLESLIFINSDPKLFLMQAGIWTLVGIGLCLDNTPVPFEIKNTIFYNRQATCLSVEYSQAILPP